MGRVFLLSPAHAAGKRAKLLLREEARFPLAERLRGVQGIALSEAFSFMSGLYFRGKLAYAECFALPSSGLAGALVITPNRGLLPAHTRVGPAELRAFGTVDIRPDDPRYRARSQPIWSNWRTGSSNWCWGVATGNTWTCCSTR
jgi:hypothetical protein